jgi:hypothetical protein
MRRWIIVLALFSFHAPATAGGLHARIEGPAADGITYTARAYGCDPNDAFEPWGLAEGVVDGKRRSVLIRPEPTGEHGVYRFTRTWPAEGRWVIRYLLGHPPSPVTVAALRTDGTVESNKLYYKSDGTRECSKKLRPRSGKARVDEGC